MSEKVAPLMEHLEELRKVIIVSAISIVIAMIGIFVFYMEPVMDIVVRPLDVLDQQLVFLSPTEGFLTQLKVAMMAGVIVASPIIIWQILKFILPALYSHEKKVFFSLLVVGTGLFVGGILFGYFFILKLGLNALLIEFSGDLTAMLSVSKYVSFFIGFLLPFGLVFEIPLIIYFLTVLGIVNPNVLAEKRKYVFFIILIIATLLSPPDVFTQLALTIPMVILYEISIVFAKLVYKRKLKKQKAKEEYYEEE